MLAVRVRNIVEGRGVAQGIQQGLCARPCHLIAHQPVPLRQDAHKEMRVYMHTHTHTLTDTETNTHVHVGTVHTCIYT
jgi:hypothetical protein